MDTALMITIVICGTVLALYITSTIDSLIRTKMRWKYGRRLNDTD